MSFLDGGQASLARGVVKRLFIEYCGYSLEPQGITLAEYVAAFERVGFRPVKWCLDRIALAKKGDYEPRAEILNLLFEHTSQD